MSDSVKNRYKNEDKVRNREKVIISLRKEGKVGEKERYFFMGT